MKKPEAATLGDLKKTGYVDRPVKDELRENLIQQLKDGRNIFDGIIGFDSTVIPQVQNAILGKHDIILLGLRGQAKSRILRMLPSLLDEFVPVVRGSEVNDNPFHPISSQGRQLVAKMGDDTPIDWLHRSERYGEKLATPDTTMADLIGDIDPIKAANLKLSYADEDVIHFGIIPRTNRGIFAVNELPDLQPRIQVGLLNVMEEKDIQIRGFNIRFPLDILMVFSANPEDYTNRGSIITPLKDRIDSQIFTHYPLTVETGIAITKQEAWEDRNGIRITLPYFFREIIENIAREARTSEYVDQKSGVSVRLTRAALEDLVSAGERRAILRGEVATVARVSDLYSLEPAITGKIELVYEGEQEGAQNVARLLVGRAVHNVFTSHFPDPSNKATGKATYSEIIEWFSKGGSIKLGTEMSSSEYVSSLEAVDGLLEVVRKHQNTTDPLETAALMELVLEGLHQQSLIGKDFDAVNVEYSDMMGSMLSSLGSFPTDDDEEDFYKDL
ncbi:MAG: magnesium chelatase [Rhodothermales bacterium]|nr:magnesium chelatase [Rhodothermales bacterium]